MSGANPNGYRGEGACHDWGFVPSPQPTGFQDKVSPYRKQIREYLHIIQSTNLEGLMIYSKGKLVQEADVETYYFLISSKKAL